MVSLNGCGFNAEGSYMVGIFTHAVSLPSSISNALIVVMVAVDALRLNSTLAMKLPAAVGSAAASVASILLVIVPNYGIDRSMLSGPALLRAGGGCAKRKQSVM